MVHKRGFDGFTTSQLIANFASVVQPLFASGVGANIVIVHEGANEIKNGVPLQQAIDNMLAYCAQARAAGWEVWICTATPRINTVQVMTDIAAFNTYVRANVSSFGERLVDLAADPSLDDPADLAFYMNDGIHPIDPGYAAIAQAVFAVAMAE